MIFHRHLWLASKIMPETISSSSSFSSKQSFCAIQAGLELRSFLCLRLASYPLHPPPHHLQRNIPHKLLLLTDSSHQEAQAFTICVPHSLLSEGQRWSTQQSQTTSEERLSTWNPQLLDKEGCSQCLPMQRGGDKVPGQMESATKHKQCHACLPSVVTVLKPSAFNKSDKKCDIDEQQLFVYFKTAMGRSLNVFNTNDKYLRC